MNVGDGSYSGPERRKEPREKNRVPCPHCKQHDNAVIRVRLRASDGVVVRRHLCACGRRFTSTQRADAAA